METAGIVKPRSMRAAVALSLLAPGLGHVYSGSMARGLVLLFVNLCVMPLGLFGFLPVSTWLRAPALAACALFAAIWVFAAFDARRTAAGAPRDFILRDYNRWYVYAVLALLSLPIAAGWTVYIRSDLVEAFKVPSASMSPTIAPGDRVFVNKLAFREGPVRHGDVAVFYNPNKRHQYHIKRVVALPGDTVEIRSGTLILNGTDLFDPGTGTEVNSGRKYAVLTEAKGNGRGALDLPLTKVPNGHCFVLGDNRANSEDSRSYGPVPLSDLVGRAEMVFTPSWKSLAPEDAGGR